MNRGNHWIFVLKEKLEGYCTLLSIHASAYRIGTHALNCVSVGVTWLYLAWDVNPHTHIVLCFLTISQCWSPPPNWLLQVPLCFCSNYPHCPSQWLKVPLQDSIHAIVTFRHPLWDGYLECKHPGCIRSMGIPKPWVALYGGDTEILIL